MRGQDFPITCALDNSPTANLFLVTGAWERRAKGGLVRTYNERCCVDVIGRQRCVVMVVVVMGELGGEKSLVY